ncbi:cyclic nucleotide-gated ion channel 1-like [Fagus crenata]
MRSLIVDDVNGRFKEDEDVYLENLLPNLPGNFQSEVKQHICLKRLKKPKQFDDMAASIIQAAWHRRHRGASKILQNPAVPVAVKSKNKRPCIVQRARRGNHRKMDDSVGASSQLQSNSSI